MAKTSIILANMVNKVLLRIKAQYKVKNTEPKNTAVNAILSRPVRCLMYAFGPWRIPKDMTKRKDPIVHKRANFLGFNARTGNIKNPRRKHSMEAAKQQPKPMIFSNRLSLNQNGSCAVVCWPL